MPVVMVQGTVSSQDETGGGAVLLDDGAELGFSAAALQAGGLRLLRVGQRVRLELDSADGSDPRDATGRLVNPDVVVARLTLVTLP